MKATNHTDHSPPYLLKQIMPEQSKKIKKKDKKYFAKKNPIKSVVSEYLADVVHSIIKTELMKTYGKHK